MTSKPRKSLVDDGRHLDLCHERWLSKSPRYQDRKLYPPPEWLATQCLTCAYYIPLVGAFMEDWGACSNEKSPFDGQVKFEHDGCEHHEEAEEQWQFDSARYGKRLRA